ncbi:MAG: ATP-binding cassette domain-containing protein [Candidatus Dadabacteria bacterium]|nr:ATP-binding cassette domain-containing protein [Candidatus Dadabacteria bacterium]NIQ14105.1 ATP-binding cassette domain-containing protein [Candidatus Dadabacteria bacterium]
MELKGVQKSYGLTTALRDINLSVKKGEFLTLFGPNGAGKSTLLGILSTLIKPTHGNAVISNLDLNKDKSGIRKKIGFIAHNHMLYESLSAFENLKYFGVFYDLVDLESRCNEILKRVGLYERRAGLVKTFSSGMKQRLTVARALLHEPEILLLDEPYNGLDQSGIKVFTDIIKSFKDKGYTIILTTHNLDEGLELSDRIAIINRGSIVHDSYEKYDKDSFKSIYESVLTS